MGLDCFLLVLQTVSLSTYILNLKCPNFQTQRSTLISLSYEDKGGTMWRGRCLVSTAELRPQPWHNSWEVVGTSVNLSGSQFTHLVKLRGWFCFRISRYSENKCYFQNNWILNTLGLKSSNYFWYHPFPHIIYSYFLVHYKHFAQSAKESHLNTHIFLYLYLDHRQIGFLCSLFLFTLCCQSLEEGS